MSNQIKRPKSGQGLKCKIWFCLLTSSLSPFALRRYHFPYSCRYHHLHKKAVVVNKDITYVQGLRLRGAEGRF